MKYVLNHQNTVIATHDNEQDIAELYPGMKIVVSDVEYDLDEIFEVEDAKDDSQFRSACQQFRYVCKRIGEVTGNPEFKGGFDEMSAFLASSASAEPEGIRLSLAWNAANELCKYEGAKIGLGQPAWWRKCWNV